MAGSGELKKKPKNKTSKTQKINKKEYDFQQMILKLIFNVNKFYCPEKLIDKMALINWVKRTNTA